VKPKGTRWTLDEIQFLVGGYFEIMPGVAPLRMLMDEQAALKHSPVNQKATEIVTKALAGQMLRYQPIIRGDVLVLGAKEKM
jgi:hypothetical protein